MIKHIVLLDLAPDHDGNELSAVMQGLDALQGKISGFVGFSHGPNRDFENMSPDCAYGCICEFMDADTSQAYLVDPDHQALGGRLVALCKGGVAGITVIDLDVSA